MNARHAASVSMAIVAMFSACSDNSPPLAPHESPGSPAVSAAIAQAGSADVSDGHGTAWRQVTETVGMTWNQLAQICPRDGIQPCAGTIAGRNLTGWVWATDSQVVELIAQYEPAIRGSRLLQGPAYDAGVAAFFRVFTPSTTGGCSGSGYIVTCSFGTFLSGWTSGRDAAGAGIQATLQAGFFAPTMIQVASDGNVGASSSTRGVFLWRADGSGGTGIVATDDAGSVDSPTGGVAVPNVLANDSLGGVVATLATVTIREITSSHTGVTLDAATGAITVAYGVPAGLRTLKYHICETARPANCDDAIVTVTVTGNIVDAVDDAGSAKTGGGIAIESVLTNDTFAGAPATLQNVTVAAVVLDPQLTLQPDASLQVAANTPVGAYAGTYRICEVGNPTNCDDAAVRVTVAAYAIDAVDDAGSAQSSPGGIAVANVLANDRFDNGAATLATVALAQVSTTNSTVTLDPATGAVRVAPGSYAGSHALVYRICERASPTNCDNATVSVTIVPQRYIVSNDRQYTQEGKSGSFTVRLSQQPSSVVSVGVSYLNGTMPVTSSVAGLTFTSANWSTPQTVTYSTLRDSDKIDNAGTLVLAASGITNAYVVIIGSDGDRKGSDPVAAIQAPFNGQTVSGAVSFWGTASDSDGSVTDVKFYVDGNRIATLAGASGTYRPPMWQSSTVANGWHTLEMRSTDNAGNSGRTTIVVFVQN
jgi:hypothetical protein